MPPVADLLHAALRAAPGPHPAPDTLREYAAGTLAPAQQHRVEAHALACEQCADLLAGLAQTDARATDQALAALRTRLHARMAQEEGPRARLVAAWPRLAAAAAVAAGLVGGAWWGWQHRVAPAAEVAAVAPTQRRAVAARAPAALPAPAAAPPAAVSGVAAATARFRPGPSVAHEAKRKTASATIAYKADKQKFIGKKSAIAASMASGAAVAVASEAPAVFADSATGQSVAAVPGPEQRVAAKRLLMSRAPGPAPADGPAALREYLRRGAAAFVPAEGRLGGTVRVRFVVGADGKINDLKVLRGLRADYDAEALRLLREGPAWVPGAAGGPGGGGLPVELDVAF